MNGHLSNEMNFAKVTNTIKAVFASASSFKKYMNEKTRLKFFRIYLENKFNYGSEFYLGDSQAIKNKYHGLTMYLTR